ncbi:MAG: rubrerythrin family protein [Chloroflexota bacterium]
MKKFSYLLIALLIGGFAAGCGIQKDLKTIENLKTAFEGESNASAKYAKFAEQARAEGKTQIAAMFSATSRAEAIHAANHKKVLKRLGVEVGKAKIKEVPTGDMTADLRDAIKGETYEANVMYPEFIKVGNEENIADARKTFTWALDTEKKHRDFYTEVLNKMAVGMDKTIPVEWYVCPVCGNTYNANTLKGSCDFCRTSRTKFEEFRS